jgi:hypothetical protein
MTEPTCCPICHGPGGPFKLANGQTRYRFNCAPYCSSRRVIEAAPSPRDEFDYLWNGPYGYEPAETTERMPS